MNNQQHLARKWAEEAKRAAPRHKYTDETHAAIEHILATTTPPTMADVEWNEEQHHLAGAVASDGTEVVMLWWDHYETGQIICHNAAWYRGELTPNGKRYELREVGGEHPETLRTVEDYENAPEGTVVTQDDRLPRTKSNTNIWTDGALTFVDIDMCSTGPHQVLRWRWGE